MVKSLGEPRKRALQKRLTIVRAAKTIDRATNLIFPDGRMSRKSHSFMESGHRVFRYRFTFGRGFLFFAMILFHAMLHSHATQTHAESQAAAGVARKSSPEALRLNTLGVAHMNQGKSADAQKYFEQALVVDANFAQARMNLGIALLAQQKLEPARAALEAASNKLPEDPFAWYNLGIAYKDLAEPEKAIAAFQHVEK